MLPVENADSIHYKQEANRIFFSLNHFTIVPFAPQFPQLIKQPTTASLRHLRSMRLLLPQPKWDSVAWKDFVTTLDTRLDLSHLTITIDASTDCRTWGEESVAELNKQMRLRTQRVVQHFEALKGKLKVFWVHLAYSLDRWEGLVETRRDQERALERRVMGEEYDGEARGKNVRRPRMMDS